MLNEDESPSEGKNVIAHGRQGVPLAAVAFCCLFFSCLKYVGIRDLLDADCWIK